MALEKTKKSEIITDYKIHDKDSGSAEVQVAVASERINYLTKHMQENKKDFSGRRGLLRLVNKRRSLLKYLRNKDVDRYRALIARLGLRK